MSEQQQSDTEEESPDVNMSRLREMAIRGEQYRETLEIEDYYDMSGELIVKPLPDIEFLPIAAQLEARMDMDVEEAEEQLEEGKADDGTIDPSEFDEEFVEVMQDAAIAGIDTSGGLAEGETEEGVAEVVDMLQGGMTLVIAERVLNMTSDAGAAESFRRDGGGE